MMEALAGINLSVALLNITLLSTLFVIAIAIARLRSLFAIVLLAGIYSLVSAVWFIALDAVDVAFTEAAVGAGISTVLFLGAMLLTARTAQAAPNKARHIISALVVIAVGAVLVYASIDLPGFGDPNSPASTHVGVEFLERTKPEIDIPNVVTAVLASYRGFDTLGEVGVVFMAGLGVVMLLGFGERALGAQLKQGGHEEPEDADLGGLDD
ncbi:MAG: DUF4040 domain-containing protein [Pseudomonadota bacterium]